jgi:hypothetical protein
MPIKGIFWDINAGRDIHVVRGGFSPDLTRSLKFLESNDAGTEHLAHDYLQHFADVTLTFTPLFKGTIQGSEFVGHQNGITVNRGTGAVRVAAAIGINVKHNFIIEIEARNGGDGRTFREAIRVHVHGSVTQVWLTPDQLTVRPIEGPGEHIISVYRFALRAQFDDGLVGDLTDGHEVTWTEPGGHVNAANGTFELLPGDRPGDSFPVTATLPARLGGASTPPGPRIRIANSLSAQATPPQMTLVAGGALPSSATVEDSLNVLLLSDGFRRADEGSFDRIVDGFVHHLKNNQLTKPFNLLSGRMNFWKLFIPAEQVGISIRSEVATVGIHPYAMPIPAVRRPPPNPPPPEPPAQWDVSNLLYAVGLPVRGDDAPARTPAVLKDEWRRLLQTDPSPNISDGLVMEWKLLAKRTLVEEIDAFPGVALGAVPAASNRNTDFLKLHPDRTGNSSQLLRLILATLGSAGMALPDGRPIGMLWRQGGTAVSATTNAAGYAVGARTITMARAGSGRIFSGDVVTFAGDPNKYVVETGTRSDLSSDPPPPERDRTIELAAPGLRNALPASAVPLTIVPFRFRNADFVVIVSALRGGRAGNTAASAGRYIVLGCGNDELFPVRAVAGKNAVALDIPAAPASVEANKARTLAHELGHSFGLGDEYVEFDEPFSEVGTRPFANLQSESDAQVPDPADPDKRFLHGAEIQWNWHRIVNAAVVNGDITWDVLGEFRIPVTPDVSFRFSLGDVVRLRARAWGQPLRKLGPSDVSGDLTIIAPPEADAIVVRYNGLLSPLLFPPGSLLYVPKPAPASVLSPDYPYAEMVAKNVKDAITQNKKPLIDTPGPNDEAQFPIVDADLASGRPKEVADLHPIGSVNLPRIVGLYPGGGTFVSGIFHPTGQCMMRNSHDAHAEFCAVCRYVMVDLVAPEFHPEIDADYDKVYPQR